MANATALRVGPDPGDHCEPWGQEARAGHACPSRAQRTSAVPPNRKSLPFQGIVTRFQGLPAGLHDRAGDADCRSGFVEGGWLGRVAGDAGDDLGGDIAEFEVAVLGGGAQDRECLALGASFLGHDDSESLVDDGA